ncbi:MAG: molybdopterin-dependent oxidoreductase [Kangiellaceae bacterium]|nr:molybdopterin-dependent oxidoreductase [Kangiellaceae bacterium]
MPVNELKSHYRTCNLCEAMCGLKIEFKGEDVVSIKGDKDDPFSHGHICPKAIALQDLYTDKDRLTSPVVKTKQGWQPIGWDEAFKLIAKRLSLIQTEFGRDAVGVYLGNPTVHNLEAMLFGPLFYRQLKTKNRFSATSVDQLPHHLAAMLMFGHPLLMPVPDIDRTNFMVILGANPVVSNGSIMSSPNIKKRLKAIQSRDGKIVTIDPRFTETSKLADQHLSIKPGSDAFLLMAMIHFLFSNDLVNCGSLQQHIDGLNHIESMVEDYTPEQVASLTGIDAETVAELVTDFCQADCAVLYARIGVSTQEFGSIVNWLVNVFNLLTGNLDSPGGSMFATPAVDMVGHKKGRTKKFARYHSRVSHYPETIGEFPVAALAEEILTDGEGQIKAMVVAAGNPLLSTPNNELLASAFEQLDFMLSIDFYINETSKYADIILPPPTPLERPHYDLIFNQLAVRNYARYSEPLFKRKPESRSEMDIYCSLVQAMAGKDLLSKVTTWFKLKSMRMLGPKGLINRALLQGPYGSNDPSDTSQTAFEGKLNLKKLQQSTHGLDLGPLKPQFPNKILTDNGRIDLAPAEFVADLARLEQKLVSVKTQPTDNESLLLIGRRDPRTCNSWMHNSYRLVKGKPGCIAHINSQDAKRLKIQCGELVMIESRVGKIKIPVEVTDTIMAGVVSIPHGWGHGVEDTQLSIANAHTGVSVNQLTDEKFVDQLTGNAALNGVPITMSVL